MLKLLPILTSLLFAVCMIYMTNLKLSVDKLVLTVRDEIEKDKTLTEQLRAEVSYITEGLDRRVHKLEHP